MSDKPNAQTLDILVATLQQINADQIKASYDTLRQVVTSGPSDRASPALRASMQLFRRQVF